MFLVIVGALLVAGLVEAATFHLEEFHGYVHSEEFSHSQTECLAECSSKHNCCAFSFILNDIGKCYTYTDCSQQEKPSVDYEKWMYYKRQDRNSIRLLDPTTESTTKMSTVTTITTSTQPTTTITKIPEDPIFGSYPCAKANKSVIILKKPNQPLVKQVNWNICGQPCAEHAKWYKDHNDKVTFDTMYTDSAKNYIVMERSDTRQVNNSRCDLLVECNPSNFGPDSLFLNGIRRDGNNYAVRITWNDYGWSSMNDVKHGQVVLPFFPNYTTSIECK